jgi:hypothetical protein
VSEEIVITQREALICEQAIELLESQWSVFATHINHYSGKKLTEAELTKLKAKLRGDQ